MDEYIKRDSAIALIEEKQKELCPVGRYGRNYVYGSDRERYDNWNEIIDALEAIPAADVALVRNSFWECYETSAYGGCKDGVVRWIPRKFYRCERCSNGSAIKSNYCPNCGAKMDLEEQDES